ncbi:unnamed protein product, partial [Mycena citricolor]
MDRGRSTGHSTRQSLATRGGRNIPGPPDPTHNTSAPLDQGRSTDRSASQSLAARGRTSFRGRSFSGLSDPIRNQTSSLSSPSIPSPSIPSPSPDFSISPPAAETLWDNGILGGRIDVSCNTGAQEPLLHLVEEAVEPDESPPAFDPHSLIQCILILCAWFHTQHHVSFRAISMLLWAITFVLTVVPGNVLGEESLPMTLKTVFARLNIHDQFKIHPICPCCHSIFPDVSPTDTKCPSCDAAIYLTRSQLLVDRLRDITGMEEDA